MMVTEKIDEVDGSPANTRYTKCSYWLRECVRLNEQGLFKLKRGKKRDRYLKDHLRHEFIIYVIKKLVKVLQSTITINSKISIPLNTDNPSHSS